MAVRTDTPQEKADASHGANAFLVIVAPLVDPQKRVFLQALHFSPGVPEAKRQIHRRIGPHRVEAQPGGEAYARAVDEQGALCVQAESLDVIPVNVMVKAVVMAGSTG